MEEGSYYFLYNNEQNKIIKYTKEQIMDDIYYLQASIPTKEQIEKHIKNNNDEITKFVLKYGIEKSIKKIKKIISRIDNKVPLYDIYSENMYIINKQNVYNRVTYNYYRFPTKELISDIENKRKKLVDKINKNIYSDTDMILKKRNVKKMELIFDFMNNFDINELYDTYIKTYYLYSDQVGKNITICKKPSFLPQFLHIKPYYTRNEIINLGLNMGLTEDKCDKNVYDITQDKLNELCKKVIVNDISFKILLKHQEYMIKCNKVGLIQYYTLHGSYIINQYLRELVSYNYKNEYLENIIKSMWELVNESPEFDKDYVLYRFVNDDTYLRHLEIGDEYVEQGFMSTTRDPFYRQEQYNFGFTLLKIRIPGGKKGVGLCVETLSHFPLEQEIILAPLTKLKLIKRDDKCRYYHTNIKFVSQVKTRYEFEYIGKEEIKFKEKQAYEEKEGNVDFLSHISKESNTLEEKIDYFVKSSLNPMFQCSVRIGEKEFILMSEFFDSTGAYKKYYAIETKKGFSLYSVHNDNIIFFIEIGIQDDTYIMHVDYNRKYSMLNRKDVISDEDFVYFISSMAYYFGINQVIIYSEYITCDNIAHHNSKKTYIINNEIKQRLYSQNKYQEKRNGIDVNEINDQNIYGGRYCVDIFNYLMNNEKRYEMAKILTIEMNPKYSYYLLDKLKKTKPIKILNKEDIDEIYQIYNKAYKEIVSHEKDNIRDFMNWLITNKCYLIEIFISKMNRLYYRDNPFEMDYYILDTNTFLYNRGYIKTYPETINNMEIKLKRNVSVLPINEYKYRNEYTLN